jgi:hypothetical protein
MKPLCALSVVLLISMLCVAQQPDFDALQRRADDARGADCARLSMQVARRSLEDAHHLFDTGNSHPAHDRIDAALRYATRAVDCTLESRKRQRPIEIELRAFIRRMRDVARTVDSEERPRVNQTVEQLERQRDRLLQAIFGSAAASSKENTP